MRSAEDLLYPLLKTYVNSPQWIKSFAGSLYRLAPKQVRYGARFSEFLDEARIIDPRLIENLKKSKLIDTLTIALGTVPAYQSFCHLLKHVPDDPFEVLKELPLIDKADIRRNIDDFISVEAPAGRRIEVHTGGSLATPMKFYIEKHVGRPREAAYFEAYEQRIAHSPREVALYLRGRNIPGIAKENAWSAYDPTRRFLLMSSDHLKPEYMPRYMDELRRYKPSLIKSFPSSLYPIARWLEQNPEPEITGRIKAIFLSSETVYEFQLRLFRRVFDCPVLSHYGLSERVLLSGSMPDDDRQFFWPLYGHLELVNEQGQPISEPGRIGEIVGTGFDNAVMPLIRYRTGDSGAYSVRPAHPALPGFPVLDRIEGRLQEFVVTRDHRLISVCTLGAAHFDGLDDVEEMQYAQSEPGKVTIRVTAQAPLTSEFKSRFASAVRAKMLDACDVEVVQVDEMSRSAIGKRSMIEQKLDLSGYSLYSPISG